MAKVVALLVEKYEPPFLSCSPLFWFKCWNCLCAMLHPEHVLHSRWVSLHSAAERSRSPELLVWSRQMFFAVGRKRFEIRNPESARATHSLDISFDTPPHKIPSRLFVFDKIVPTTHHHHRPQIPNQLTLYER